MGLIIKDKLPKFKVGYPTVSDKYNVTGGTLVGTTAVEFGDLVKFSTTKGYYEAITSAVTLKDVAGFVLATNVKLVTEYGGDTIKTLPGEAFNLALGNTFMAIKLDSAAVEADITPNSKVELILATGKITTSSKENSGTIEALPGVVFTGEYEKLADNTIIAEIFIK